MNMQRISKVFCLNVFTTLLILLAIAKVISLGIWWFLPSDGVNLQERISSNPPYRKIDFRTMLVLHAKVKVVPKKVEKVEVISTENITNMMLKGIYNKEFNSMAIVALKSSPKRTTVVSIGEIYSGYTLIRVYKSKVIFRKNAINYTLSMGTSNIISEAVFSSANGQKIKKIARRDIQSYIKNQQQLQKDIAISPLGSGKNLRGFKVLRIKRNSKIEILGLKKGDVIVRANNVELKSYKNVLDIYKNIKTLKRVELTVIRDSKEKELIYEING